jgi:hypothetical protein
MDFYSLFKNRKPLIGMIHTNRTLSVGMLDLAKREIGLYLKYGVYPLVENYYGSVADCEQVLAWLHEAHPEAVFGVNILGRQSEAFRLAGMYGAKFIQVDSVCGHLEPKNDAAYAERLAELRKTVDVVLLGGVRFKYQPVCSGRTLEEDLLLGMERCDAIVCTGEGTGIPTPMGKVEEFKAVLNDFPVVVGAGVTLNTVAETFEKADGAIVGTWVKTNHETNRPVDETLLTQLKQQINEL